MTTFLPLSAWKDALAKAARLNATVTVTLSESGEVCTAYRITSRLPAQGGCSHFNGAEEIYERLSPTTRRRKDYSITRKSLYGDQ